MNDYVRTNYVNASKVDKYLSEGWEIFETTKVFAGPEETDIKYHIGLASRTLMKKYESIIRDYEKHGLKDELLKRVAENNGHNIEEYEGFGWNGKEDDTSKYLTYYENTVNDSNSIYTLKKKSDEEFSEIDF